MSKNTLVALVLLFTSFSLWADDFEDSVITGSIQQNHCFDNELFSPQSFPDSELRNAIIYFCFAEYKDAKIIANPIEYLVVYLRGGESQIFQLTGFTPDQTLSLTTSRTVLRSLALYNTSKHAQLSYIYKIYPLQTLDPRQDPDEIFGVTPTGLHFSSRKPHSHP